MDERDSKIISEFEAIDFYNEQFWGIYKNYAEDVIERMKIAIQFKEKTDLFTQVMENEKAKDLEERKMNELEELMQDYLEEMKIVTKQVNDLSQDMQFFSDNEKVLGMYLVHLNTSFSYRFTLYEEYLKSFYIGETKSSPLTIQDHIEILYNRMQESNNKEYKETLKAWKKNIDIIRRLRNKCIHFENKQPSREEEKYVIKDASKFSVNNKAIKLLKENLHLFIELRKIYNI